MKKPIRVHILGREYTLRVEEEVEPAMRALAVDLDERMRAFRETHPTQPEVTAAVITALALAEEVYTLRRDSAPGTDGLAEVLDSLADRLDEALA